MAMARRRLQQQGKERDGRRREAAGRRGNRRRGELGRIRTRRQAGGRANGGGLARDLALELQTKQGATAAAQGLKTEATAAACCWRCGRRRGQCETRASGRLVLCSSGSRAAAAQAGEAGEQAVAGGSRGRSDAAWNSGDGEVDADEAAVRAKRRARGRALLRGARLPCGFGVRESGGRGGRGATGWPEGRGRRRVHWHGARRTREALSMGARAKELRWGSAMQAGRGGRGRVRRSRRGRARKAAACLAAGLRELEGRGKGGRRRG